MDSRSQRLPGGAEGTEITIVSRIVSVIHAFDVMVCPPVRVATGSHLKKPFAAWFRSAAHNVIRSWSVVSQYAVRCRWDVHRGGALNRIAPQETYPDSLAARGRKPLACLSRAAQMAQLSHLFCCSSIVLFFVQCYIPGRIAAFGDWSRDEELGQTRVRTRANFA